MGVSIIIPPMSQPSMGPCPRHSLRHFLSVLSHRAFHAILNRTCPLLLPFPTPALTAFYNECVLGRGLPGNKVGVLLPSVLPRALCVQNRKILHSPTRLGQGLHLVHLSSPPTRSQATPTRASPLLFPGMAFGLRPAGAVLTHHPD